jgi:RNA polymerase sigma-70 factor (ECF subfamily)
MTVPVLQSAAGFPQESEGFVAELYQDRGGGKFGLTLEQFASLLQGIVARYLPDAERAECEELCRSLRIEDLVLARACAAGSESAWDVFLNRYRAKLYDIAGYITRENSRARDLADSIYAELYGTETRDGNRTCKLASYSGRGSLEGWLRTVMAQEYVNRHRRERRLVSIDEEDGQAERLPAKDPDPVAPVDARVEAATDDALGELKGEERFLLASYYLDGRTLAEIAHHLGVHESTISRKLERISRSLRKKILGALTKNGMSRRQAEEALEVDVRDLQINLRPHLLQKGDAEPFSKKKPGGEPAGIVE